MSGGHLWGYPDADGARPCLKEGCTVRTARSFSIWQRKRGGHWRRQDRELIPDCKGTLETTETKP